MSEVNKYQYGKIYRIVNNIDNEVYIGSTCKTLNSRFSTCKTYANKETENRKLFIHMRNLGIDNFRIELVEDYPCFSKEELLIREDYWLSEIGTLNEIRAHLTTEERENKWKVYYEKNTDSIFFVSTPF